VELQRQASVLQAQGLGLAVITYDPPDVLKRFATERGITYPLLSDAGSAIIKRYGILNTTVAEGTRAYGVPFPGTFILDPKGVVVSRYFEDAYQERNTVASILTRQGGAASGPSVSIRTAHVDVMATASDRVVSPGSRLSLAITVTPAPKIHVYAPGKHTYQVVRFQPASRSWLKTHPLTYPPSEIYHFVPLDERVETYQKPFTLVQDLTILATPDVQKALAGQTSITIDGQLEYQACDDKVCYSPASVPISLALELTPLVRPTPAPGRN
jgi:AhpC/TSA family/Disulphide bond corrector protein DsbC